MEDFEVFKKESLIYQDVLPQIQSIFPGTAPKCYYAANNLLVFEDLASQGYKMVSGRDGLLDYEHLNCSLKCLAALHAGSIVYNVSNDNMNVGDIHILSKSECLEIVRKALKSNNSDDLCLTKYAVNRGSNDLVGFMGEYYKLDIYFQKKPSTKDEHLSFFIKSVPISNELHRHECERKGFFKKETRIYNEILCNIQRYSPTKLFPECYYTRNDLIVLENLSSTNLALRHINPNEHFTMDHYKIVLRHQAKFHAASIAWEIDDNFNIGERFKDILFEIQITLNNEWYVTGIKGILFLAKMHDKFQTPSHQDFINHKLYKILKNACSLTDPSKNLRNVLCHRDCWERNIFFEYSNSSDIPIDCRIVDFQLTRYSVPGIDVLFFLYCTATSKRRNEIYNECLDYYYECLRESLKSLSLPSNIITKTEFLEGCKRSQLAMLIVWAICEPLIKMPEGLSTKMRAEEQERFDFYMNTQRDELFMRVMEIDATYKDIINSPVEELIEFLFENKELCEEFS